MDAIDRVLIKELLRDARVTYQELGRAARLSANTVADRVRRLRSSGVLSGYHAQLNLAMLGRNLQLMSDVRLSEGKDRSEFERGLIAVEQVIDRLKRDHGVREIRSRLVLHEVPIDLERLLDASEL